MQSSKKIPLICWILTLLVMILASCKSPATIPADEELEKKFHVPPADAGPEVWWHWLNGNISREGISRDLEELSDKGYRGATAFSIGHNIFSEYAKGPVRYMSPEWYDLFHHALSEADRLGLKLMFHNCDGWATSGGPWLAPEDAMKELTYSEINIKGPEIFKAQLPEPGKTGGFYRDIAIIAHPVRKQNVSFMTKHKASAMATTGNENLPYLFDNNPSSHATLSDINRAGEVSLTLKFREPVAVSQLYFYHTRVWGEAQAVRCELFVRDTTGEYHSLLDFNHRQPISHYEFEETWAQEFKLLIHSFNRWDEYVIQQVMKIQEFQLLPPGMEPMLPLISDWENKAGYNNNRVNGNFLEQEPLDPDLVIPAKEQINLTDHFSEGRLNWEVPAGEWKVIRLGYTITGKPNEPSTEEGRGLECDKFSAASVEAFFSGLPEQIMQQNKKYLGETLHAMLIDSWEAANQNWTGDLPAYFKERRGYSMEPWLLVLCGRVVESVEASERFLWDFRRTFGDLIAENYYGKMAELSHQYGVFLQAEAAHVALQFMVDAINYHSKVDIPMNEFWIYPDSIGYLIRPGFSDAPSAAHLYDKKIVACESFTSAQGNWRHTPYWLKPAADKVFCMGVNRITFDTYTHQPDERVPGWNLAPWGTAHNWKLTWWDYEKPWIEYLSRCQYLLQQGEHAADFLVFTGEGVPSFLQAQSGNNNGLVPDGYAFDGCNRETLLGRLRVEDGNLMLPHGPSYRAIILPDDTRMTPELTIGLVKLVKAGATVFGPKPLSSPSLHDFPQCDKQVREAADLAWGENKEPEVKVHHYGKGKTASGMSPEEMVNLLGMVQDMEFRLLSGQADLEYIHKRMGHMDMYFISNQHPGEADVVCTFRIKGKNPELWHPDEGRIDQDLAFRIKNGRTEIPIHFDPYGSVFVIFRRELRKEDTTDTGKKPGWDFNAGIIIDTMGVSGPWTVHFSDGMGAPDSTRFDELGSWTLHGDEPIKYYSGTAIYKKEIHLNKDFMREDGTVWLSLGRVKEIANVWINGKHAGILWKPPFEIEAGSYLQPGNNKMEIHVVNTWTNRLIGDLFLPEDQRHTWVNCCLPLNRSSSLMESGLLGPVEIRIQSRD